MPDDALGFNGRQGQRNRAAQAQAINQVGFVCPAKGPLVDPVDGRRVPRSLGTDY
jgi:hypothetical protein